MNQFLVKLKIYKPQKRLWFLVVLTPLHLCYWYIISLANFNGTGQVCCCFVIINPTPSPLDMFFLETGRGGGGQIQIYLYKLEMFESQQSALEISG
jgi:hypothetical protein